MNISLTNKASFFILFLITILLSPFTAFPTTEEATDWLDEPINLNFQNEPLSNVLKQISQQTGISIAYDQKLANEKMSGNYQNIRSSDAITRLFRSKNKTIQVNKEKKVIIIKTFGAKNFIWANKTQKTTLPSQMTLPEIEQMHAQQFKEYNDSIANDNEILAGGVTRGEIHILHKKQNESHHARLMDDNEILGGGMTRGEIHSLHKKQNELYRANLMNYNEILGGGMTRGEIHSLHQEQNELFHARLKTKSETLSDGMTLDEIHSLHQKQELK